MSSTHFTTYFLYWLIHSTRPKNKFKIISATKLIQLVKKSAHLPLADVSPSFEDKFQRNYGKKV